MFDISSHRLTINVFWAREVTWISCEYHVNITCTSCAYHVNIMWTLRDVNISRLNSFPDVFGKWVVQALDDSHHSRSPHTSRDACFWWTWRRGLCRGTPFIAPCGFWSDNNGRILKYTLYFIYIYTVSMAIGAHSVFIFYPHILICHVGTNHIDIVAYIYIFCGTTLN